MSGSETRASGSRMFRGIALLFLAWVYVPCIASAQPIFTGTSNATLVTDVGGDGQASIGDTFEVTVEVANTAAVDAVASTITLNIDSHATLIHESVNVSPIIRDDTYAAVGNVARSIASPSGVLSNDIDVDSDIFSVTAFDSVSLRGGTVTLAPNGGFSYVPPLGVSGTTDEFNYTVTDSRGLASVGKVTITLAGRVWFVDSRAGTSGNGSSTAPFNSLAPFLGPQRPDSPGDFILVRSGGAPYTGGLTLLAQETLVGDFAGLNVGGVAVVPPSGSRPTIASSSGSTVLLGNGSAVRALALSASGTEVIRASGVSGAVSLEGLALSASSTADGIRLTSSSAAFSVSDVQLSITGSGAGIIANGLSGAVTVSSSTVAVGTGRAFDISNQTGGAFSTTSSTSGFSGPSGGAVRVANITGGSVSLGGVVAASSVSTPALVLQGTVASLQVQNSSFSGAGTSPLSVSSLQGSVMLDQTMVVSDRTIDLSAVTSGSFSFGDVSVVPASGEAVRVVGGGGMVQLDSLSADMSASASPAVLVQNHTGGVEIAGGLIEGFTGGPAVSLMSAENIVLSDLTIDGDFASVANGIEADSVDGLMLVDVEIREIGDNSALTSGSGTETALLLSHLSGTVGIGGSTIHFIGRDAISVDNNVSGDTTGEALSFTIQSSVFSDVGEFTMLLDSFLNDTNDISIVDTTIRDVGDPSLRAVTLQYSGNGANSLTVQDSVLDNTGDGSLFVRAQDLAAVDVVIENSAIDATVSEGIFLRAMGQSGTPLQSQSTIRARIQNNIFGAAIGLEGVYADVEDDGGNLEIALSGNIDAGTGAGLSTIQASTGSARVCGRIIGNSSPLNPGLNAVNGGTFALEGFGGGGAAAAESYLESQNPSLQVFTSGTFSGGVTCVTP